MRETVDYDKIIRTNCHRPNYFRALAILVCALLILTLGYYFISPNQTKTYGKVLAEAGPQLTKEEKEMLFRNACKEAWKDSWDENKKAYIICCEESEKLYRCDDKKKFRPGQFLVVGVAFQRLNTPERYFVCSKSDLNEVDGHAGSYKECSPRFLRNESHGNIITGYVPNQKSFKLIELFFYPDGNYSEGELLSYVDHSTPNFELVGSV
ncbi:MAG: hypothetical protein J7K31_03330 [Candidatus Aenigmarchaeota archaeon]|nr:hypothetical protein [Candidatus Aenigmarchaeota archaeon]